MSVPKAFKALRPGLSVDLNADGSAIVNGERHDPGSAMASGMHAAAGYVALQPERSEPEHVMVPDALIDPATMRTGRHKRLLETLVEWTSDERLIAALMRCGVDTKTIVQTVGYVNLTLKTKGETGLSERQMAAQILYFFLRSRPMRQAVAAHVHRVHGIPKRQAMRDLWEMRKELLLEFGVREE